MRCLTVVLTGCVGLGGGQDASTERIAAPTGVGTDPTSPHTEPTDPGGVELDTATPGTTAPPEDTARPPPTREDCAGSFSIPISQLPSLQAWPSCPGEVHHFDLTEDYGFVWAESDTADCDAIQVVMTNATGGASYNDGCGSAASEAVTLEVRNTTQTDYVWYEVALHL